MKKLNSYMNPFQKWVARWKLRRIIVALESQTEFNQHITAFVRSLEATEIMSRGNKKHSDVLITIERQQLDAFIRYMCSLHDSKLSRIILARVGLACLVMRDETALKAPPETVIKQEQERTGGSRAGVIKTVGNLEIPR
jgi:hypothetical protein